MKRFWREATVVDVDWGHGVALDGRRVTTPRKRPLVMPGRRLAELVAAEWAAQDATIAPATMPVNRLATTAVDLMPERRAGAIQQVVEYAQTDLVCYRAGGPRELVERQALHWDPPLAWLAETRGARLRTAGGLMPVAQPEDAVRAVTALVTALGDWRLVGVHAVTTATGSVVLGLMMEAGAIDAAGAGEAALVDERFERERWGDEADALDRERRVLADVQAAHRFLRALDPD